MKKNLQRRHYLHTYMYYVWIFKRNSFRYFLNFSLDSMLFMNNEILFQNHIDLKIKECWNLLLLHWGRLKFSCVGKLVGWWWSGLSLSIAEASSGKSEKLKCLWNFMASLHEKADSMVMIPFVWRKILFELL